jgi:hypothetical protein
VPVRDARRHCRQQSGRESSENAGPSPAWITRPALILVQAKLFEDLWEQSHLCQVSIAKKSQAPSPLIFVDGATAPQAGSGRAVLEGAGNLVSSNPR